MKSLSFFCKFITGVILSLGIIISETIHAQEIRIISSNILGEDAYKKFVKCEKMDFTKRAKAFTAFLKTQGPDVMCLQEADASWATELQKITDYTFHCNQSSYLAILFNPKKLILIETITDIQHENQSKGIQAYRFKTMTGQEFVVINIHALFKPAAQTYEYDHQKTLTPLTNIPVFAMGDLNTGSTNNATFFPTLFKDFQELTKEITVTSRNVNTNQPEKLDYIYGRNIDKLGIIDSVCTVPSCSKNNVKLLLPHVASKAFNTADENNFYSDHAAVIVTITLPEKEPTYSHPTILGIVEWDTDGFLILKKDNGTIVRVAPNSKNPIQVYIIDRSKPGQENFGFKKDDKVARDYSTTTLTPPPANIPGKATVNELSKLKGSLEQVGETIKFLQKKLKNLQKTIPQAPSQQKEPQLNTTDNVYITLVQGADLPYQRFVNWQKSATVNPANSSLNSGGLGEGAFIEAATGNSAWGDLLKKNRTYWEGKGWTSGDKAKGNAVISDAGNLCTAQLMNYIIHAVGPCLGKTEGRKLILKETYESILAFADMKPSDDLVKIGLGDKNNYKGLEAVAISLAGLGSWVGDQGLGVESKLVIGYVLDYLKAYPTSQLKEVRFITYSKEEYDIFKTALTSFVSQNRLKIANNIPSNLLTTLNQSCVKNPTGYKSKNTPLIFTLIR